MKAFWKGSRLLALPLALCLLKPVAISKAEAGVLNGQIVSENGVGKYRAKVTIIAAKRHILHTDSNGNFTISLPKGKYDVFVAHRRNRAKFKVRIPDEGEVTRRFKVEW